MLEPKFVPTHGSIASAIMDHIKLPVFFVEQNAAVRYCNAAAIAALQEGESFRQADNILSSVHPSDSGRLKAAIATTWSHGERHTIMINDFKNPRPQIVTVVPFSEDEAHAENGALVLVQRCDPSDGGFAESLRQMFRLSAAETAIAAALVSGADVEQIAEMRNAKITTVRTQIAAMMLKTRTRRQGELVALLSRVSTLP